MQLCKQQSGYINLDGLVAVMATLAAFGLFGIFALFYWLMPAVWAWIKPWLHMVSG